MVTNAPEGKSFMKVLYRPLHVIWRALQGAGLGSFYMHETLPAFMRNPFLKGNYATISGAIGGCALGAVVGITELSGV